MVNVFKEQDTALKYTLLGLKIIVFSMAITIALSMLFGFRLLKVTSGSMVPTYGIGDVVFVNTKYDYDKLKIGDVITYKAGTSNVTHRIVEIAPNGLVVTQGDANGNIDTACGTNVKIVTGIAKKDFVGKVTFGIKGMGKFLESIAKPANFIILSVSLILILFVTIM
jgi:signal peptidase